MTNKRILQIRPSYLLEAGVLMALRQWNSYGYELMVKTAALWEEAINPGTLYRTLRQMENNGDVESTWDTTKPEPARRIYSITDAGEAYLDLWMASLRQSQRNIAAFLRLYHRQPTKDN